MDIGPSRGATRSLPFRILAWTVVGGALSGVFPTRTGTDFAAGPLLGGQASGQTAGGALSLPEGIEPQALARALADQPQSYLLLDVRPAWAFAEYHVPGARSVTPEQAIEQATAASATTRLVIVDRDGTIAWAVAGVIGHVRSERVVRVLDGGTARYWREVEIQSGSGGPAAAVPVQPGVARPPADMPAAAKKRSAGC
jgi:rhodanese-related sulfurtransferase